ncbi:adenylosuccinate synthase [Adlercreutzia murintestinalis]|uniref:adenylosuccinate synthase n=1 Tax=Adlercreutzia murintestinalis TaxID=2941325 RepID=UPI0020421568|nr:adenylosuccinate synthase [Adlercreutzia murintestinalis]
MPSTVLVGTQWGDEGKGKITDLISRDFDYVVRFQGGNNAGHTVIHGDTKLALHLMPSGVVHPDAVPVIGNGVVVDPGVLVKEMALLEGEGISCDKLRISCDAHVIMPYHKALDGAEEKRLGTNQIGTTKRGIGPCYQDKAARRGIRMQDLLDEKIFRLKVETALAQKNPILSKIYGLQTYTVEEICEEYLPYARILRDHVWETAQLLSKALRQGKNILFEGAQGTMLDIDHGTYPYVTSSSCVAGGACTGAGVGPGEIGRVLGIQKAYVTRVGGGPFPTELKFAEDGGTGQDAADGETLCQEGHEYGVTTGRKRRCGWFDAVIARYAAQVNGLTHVALTKLDVLSAFDTIKVCVAYECDGKEYDYFPMQQSVLFHAKPVYEELPGWKGHDLSGVRDYMELPVNTRRYIEYLEELGGVPMSLISVGPDRDQTIIREDWLEAEADMAR